MILLYCQQLLNYREPALDTKSYDPSIHCNYCGEKLDNKMEYCSDLCKEKDSIWHN